MRTKVTKDRVSCEEEGGEFMSQDIPKKQVDWERIAENMRTPKWLFDGWCIIETKKMTKLGIRVESIGSSGDAI
ncbi:hypothetical protein N7467_000110 [Penicillium canescens]|nr:hypothetical protein N7467_000110 [Penicillium canescens]